MRQSLFILAAIFGYVLAQQGAASGTGKESGQIVKAKQFVVVDDAGNERASLGFAPDGRLSLLLWNNKKESVGGMQIDRDGMPRFFIEGKNGVLMDFGIAENHYPVFVMCDGDGTRRVAILARKKQQSGISFFDGNQQERCTLGLGEDGDPRLTMSDAAKVNRARLMVDSTGTSALDLLDGQSRERVVFQVEQKGNADGVVFDSDGSPKWRSGK